MERESERQLTELEALLASGDWEEREEGLRRAASWVRTLPTQRLRDRLASHLPRLAADEKWEVRAWVARLLQDFEPDAFDALVSALRQDPHAQVVGQAERAQLKWRRAARERARRERALGRLLDQQGQAPAEEADRLIAFGRAAVSSLSQEVAHDLRRGALLIGDVLSALRAGKHYKAQAPLFARLDLQVEQLMAFAADIQAYADDSPPSFGRESVRELVERAAEFARLGARPEVELVLDVSRELWVEVPKAFAIRALGNLLRNALEAIVARGRISVAAHEEEGAVVLSIEDDGRGMDPSEVGALFAPLTSTKKGSASEVHTGMGLPIAQKVIVDDVGGTLEVEWTAPGQGTRVVVRLPLRQEGA